MGVPDGTRGNKGRGKKGEFHVSSSTILMCGESWGNLKNITPGKTSQRGESWSPGRQVVLGQCFWVEKDSIFKGIGLKESRSLKPRKAWAIGEYGWVSGYGLGGRLWVKVRRGLQPWEWVASCLSCWIMTALMVAVTLRDPIASAFWKDGSSISGVSLETTRRKWTLGHSSDSRHVPHKPCTKPGTQ